MLIRKHFFIPTLMFILALSAIQQSNAGDITSRATLTQATLELQRDLLIVREKHLKKERTGLHIYLNINNLTSSKPSSLSVNLANKQLLKKTFNEKQLKGLVNNGMQKLGSIDLPQGKHKLTIKFKTNQRTTTKTFALEKSAGRDNLKISLSKPLQQHTPEIIFKHETWAAVQ
ncbi:MAG TPA: hypothetical protein ENJ65_00220 [Candidatus Tenderia electrophaga]|uniref:DUF4426 domain-containing protein n=1 Tax=Candidatus Tenderia electrophaga TaxID=1748243 RepID=A0A832J826_9GAMM|nr:hypothetical protein [Candidatus Tenderia electrophaga]